MSDDDSYWRDDEEEKELAANAYHAIAQALPETVMPDELGEIESAIVIGVDDDQKIHTICAGPEENQDILTNSSDVIQHVLSNFEKYKLIYEEMEKKSDNGD